MTVKSVVDIDVNDAQFRRFSELFGKYQTQLGKIPGQWKDAATAEKAAGSEFEKILASFFAMGELQREILDSSDKDNKNLAKKASMWQGIKKSTGGILDDVDKMTKTLLKWGLIGFGAGTASLLGIRAIAESVSADRRFALGTGLDIGAQQAFARHQGRLLDDPSQFLTAAFNARSNVQSPAFAAIASLGISPNQSTVAIANQVLTKAQSLAKSVPQQQLGTLLAEFPGLSQFGIGLNTLQQLRSISGQELQGQIKAFAPDLASTRLSDKQGAAFQNFVTGVDATFAKVERQFERDLVKLLPPIEHFVERLGDIIHKFLASPAAAKAIDSLANAIEGFADSLGSAQFSTAIDNFTAATGTLVNFLTPFGAALNPSGSGHELGGALADLKDTGAGGLSLAIRRAQVRAGADASTVDTEDQRILGNLGFLPEQYRVSALLTDFYLKQSRGGAFKERDFINSLRGAQDPGAFLRSQPADARRYAADVLSGHVRVVINNNTGGNAHASVAQLTGGVGQ